jgi:hypothetical protein
MAKRDGEHWGGLVNVHIHEDDEDYLFLNSYWRFALVAIDQKQDKRLLCDVLRQAEPAEWEDFDDEFTPHARHHLADMLDRYDLKLSLGTPETTP